MKVEIDYYKNSFPSDEKYSFYNGTKIFLNNNVTPEDAIKSIACILFARDYFNFDSIRLLREYLIKSPMANILLKMNSLEKSLNDDILSIFLSDYKILNNILFTYDILNIRYIKDILYYESSLEINGKLNVSLFDYICALIYLRYIISIYISLIEHIVCPYIDDKNIEQYLLRMYRTLGLVIIISIYKNISLSEIMWFQQITILNDILVYSYYVSPASKVNELESIFSTCYAYYGHKYFGYKIRKIVDEALEKWKNGCEYSHIEMIKYFKRSTKYKSYFDERGFERNLNKELKIRMKDAGINKIVGDGYYPKGYKRPRKKKEDS